ncbi:MAG: protein kinase [Planctomycetota bacterium]
MTRAEGLYAAHAAGGVLAPDRLEQLCLVHSDLAPVLRQVDYVQRCLQSAPDEDLPTAAGYRVERRIGRGGMGQVFAAHHLRLDRLVALKLVHAPWAEDGATQERFLREARAMAQITHRHVAPIYDVVTGGSGSALAMELVAGADLAAVAACLGEAFRTGASSGAAVADLLGDDARGPWPGAVPFLVGIANQVAQALSAVHAAGLLHRDVKPSNIRIRSQERDAVLLDFGVARRRDEVTHHAGFVGTPGFASPEQIAAADLDERTDLYALGRTLQRCLRTALDLEADADEERTPIPIHPLRAQVSPDLDAVLHKALEHDPRDRYQSASALARDLAAVRDGLPVSARPRGRLRRAAHWVVRDRTRLLLAGTSLLLIVLGVVLWLQWPRVVAARAREHAQAVERALAHAHHLVLDPTRRREALAAFTAVQAMAPESEEAALGAVAAAILSRHDARAEDLLAAHPTLRRFESELDRLRQDPPLAPTSARVDPGERQLITMLRYMRALRTGSSDDFAVAAATLQRLRWFEPRARELHYGMMAYAATRAGTAQAHRELRGVAEQAVSALRSLWPRSASAHAWIAVSRLHSDPADARAAANEAMRLDPELTAYLRPMTIDALIAAGDLQAADAALTKALAAEPKSPTLHMVRCNLATARADDEAALAACRAALELAPDCLPALTRIAEILWQHDKGAAAPYLEQLAELAPFLPQPHQNLGRLRFAAKDFEAAHAHLERAVELDPRDGISLCLLGECRFHLRHEATLETLQAAARALTTSARPHYFLARELHRRGELDRAVDAAETALRLVEAGDDSVRDSSVRNAVAQLRRLRGR